MRKRGTSKYYVYTKPSKKAIASIKDKAKEPGRRRSLPCQSDGEVLQGGRGLSQLRHFQVVTAQRGGGPGQLPQISVCLRRQFRGGKLSWLMDHPGLLW